MLKLLFVASTTSTASAQNLVNLSAFVDQFYAKSEPEHKEDHDDDGGPIIEVWDNELPTLIFHGVDDACDAGFINETKELIAESAAKSGKKNIVVECIVEGKIEAFTSIFTSMKKQTDDYCKKVKAHPIFSKTDFNIIGFSQGALAARAMI